MSDVQPVIVVVYGASRGLRLTAALSSLHALNEERGVIVDYQLEPSIQGLTMKHLDDALESVNEVSHFDEVAFSKLCATADTAVKQRIQRVLQPINKPWYRHNQRW